MQSLGREVWLAFDVQQLEPITLLEQDATQTSPSWGLER
jgi:hypothetical protein